MSSNEQIIKEMANLTLLSGQINALQEKNLKMFPLVMFDGISSVEIEYDLMPEPKVEYEQNKTTMETKFSVENRHQPKVQYRVKIDESKENLNIDKRFKALEQAVRTLFWPDTKVVIYFNDKIVFESGKNVQ